VGKTAISAKLPGLVTEPQMVRDVTWSRIDLSTVEAYVVVGPQNSGKSTLCKYLANRLRSSDPKCKLYMLDADCG